MEIESLLEKEEKSEDKIKKIAFGVGLALFSVSILMYLYYQKNEDKIEIIEKGTNVMGISYEVINNTKNIYVDISGAVKIAGLYNLEEGARMNELIEKAGGFSSEADKEWIAKSLNLAYILKDGQKVYIPFENEVVTMVGGVTSGSNKVNINTASLSELTKLSGVGEVTAKAILKYREEKGSFGSVNEILKVEGIGEKTLEKFKEEIEI